MRMALAPQVRADFSAPTCRARAIRVTAGALSGSTSEGELQGQLDTPRIVRLLGGGDLPEGRAGRVRIRPREKHVIERVQEISPELDVLVFENLGLLRQREINVVDLIGAEETESQRGSTDGVYQLEIRVPIEAQRIAQRRPRTTRRIEAVLAWVVEINQHRRSIVRHNSKLAVRQFFTQCHEAGRVEPTLPRLRVTGEGDIFQVPIVEGVAETERNTALEL